MAYLRTRALTEGGAVYSLRRLLRILNLLAKASVFDQILTYGNAHTKMKSSPLLTSPLMHSLLFAPTDPLPTPHCTYSSIHQ